ncbi:MAG: hypothetical protein Tsb0013_07770 [Phycisphaerales bacterium]
MDRISADSIKSKRVSANMIRVVAPEHVVSYRTELIELAMADARPVRESTRFVLSRVESIDYARHVQITSAIGIPRSHPSGMGRLRR